MIRTVALVTLAGAASAQTCTPVVNAAEVAELVTFLNVLGSLQGYQPAREVLDPVNTRVASESPSVGTLFAPTDVAFAETALDLDKQAKWDEIVKTHVLPDEVMAADITSASGPVMAETLSGEHLVASTTDAGDIQISVYGSDAPAATVLTADVSTCTGTVHILDRVLMPAPCESVLDAIAKQPALSMLYEAASTALDPEQLAILGNSSTEVTVLAPSNAAFTTADDALATLAPDAVADVLLLHFVPVQAFAADLLSGDMLPTLLEGTTLEVASSANGASTFSPDGDSTGASLVEADVAACSENAALHIIDAVLLPPADAMPAPAPAAAATGPVSDRAFPGAPEAGPTEAGQLEGAPGPDSAAPAEASGVPPAHCTATAVLAALMAAVLL